MKPIQTALFTALVHLVFLTASCQTPDSSHTINNQQFQQLAADSNAVILDVRTSDEYTQGHIPNAVHADVLNEKEFKSYIVQLPKEKKYLLYCRSGKRSATAVQLMRNAGFSQVVHLKDGISGWNGVVVQ